MEKRTMESEELGIPLNAVVKVTTIKHIVEVQWLEKQNTGEERIF